MDGLRDAMRVVHDDSLRVRLSFDGLSYKLRDGTRVLSDASGEVRSCEVTAIMGPSGCGKSTLLGLLSGKLTPSGGSLRINGARLKVSQISKLVAFVPQDDVMLTALTVDELLRFSAQIPAAARRPTGAARRLGADGDRPPRADAATPLGRRRRHAARPLGRPAQARQHRTGGGRRPVAHFPRRAHLRPRLDRRARALRRARPPRLVRRRRLCGDPPATAGALREARSSHPAHAQRPHRVRRPLRRRRRPFRGPRRAFAPNENAADQLLDVVSGAKESSGVAVDELAAKWNEHSASRRRRGRGRRSERGRRPAMADRRQRFRVTGADDAAAAAERASGARRRPTEGAPRTRRRNSSGRLTDHGGRRTAGRCRQLVLFSGRRATPSARAPLCCATCCSSAWPASC